MREGERKRENLSKKMVFEMTKRRLNEQGFAYIEEINDEMRRWWLISVENGTSFEILDETKTKSEYKRGRCA